MEDNQIGEFAKFVRYSKRHDNAIKACIRFIVTAVVIMADYDRIYHDNECGDDNLINLIYAHLHLNRK